MGQKIAYVLTYLGSDVIKTEIDTDLIVDFREYPDKPNYCEVEVSVDGRVLYYPVNESQKDFRKRFKHFSTRKELDADAISADYSFDKDDY